MMHSFDHNKSGKWKGKRNPWPVSIRSAEAVFRLSPRALRDFLEVKYPTQTLDEDIDADDEQDDADLDAEELDDDAPLSTPENEYASMFDNTGSLADEIGPAANIDLSSVYRIDVLKDPDSGSATCVFEPFDWMLGDYPDEQAYLGELISMLEAVAAWMEREKQEFLLSMKFPSMLNGETSEHFRTAPLVTFDGFLARTGADSGKDAFSTVVPHVYIVSDDSILGLSTLFSDPMKIQWVVYACRSEIGDPDVWRRLRIENLPNYNRVRHAKRTEGGYKALDPAQRLVYLFRQTGLRDESSMIRVLQLLGEQPDDDAAKTQR